VVGPQTGSDAQTEDCRIGQVDMTSTEPPAAPEGGRSRSGFWPEVSGALAVGLAVLALAVLGFQIVAWAQGKPGPGLLTVGGHVLAAGLALLVQRLADRWHGWRRTAAVLAVAVLAGVTLWLFWWA
jgi:hypothetical protein